jgi:hypothetical protein
MKHTSIITFLLISSFIAHSQNRFGIESGILFPTFGIHLGQYNISHSANPSLTMELNYLRKMNKRLSLGCKLSFQQYVFIYSDNDSHSSYSDNESINVNSNYIFVAPTFDVGLGKHQDIHCFISAAFGGFITGKQVTQIHKVYNFGQFNSVDDTTNSTDPINKFLFRLNFGFQENGKLWKHIHITFTEGLCLGSSNMTAIKQSYVRPSCFFFQIGIMKEYSHAKTAPDKSVVQ